MLSRDYRVTGSDSAHKIARSFWDESLGIYESFNLICLSKANCPIAWVEISKGGVDATVADLRLIFSHALLCLASGIIVFHNHPSGNLTPSQADINLTELIKKAGEILNIKLLDHLILSETGYYSFADEGMI